jgi:hypothetical protein
MKRWDIVLAYWHDSAGTGKWTDTEAALDIIEPSQCWTAGFYLGETHDCISIASSASDNDSVDHVMYIPKACLIKMQIMQKGAK